MFHLNNHPLLLQHPLRLFSTPTVPETMEEEQKQIALWVANSRNSLISFEFGDKFGFIEPMPNYSEIEQALKSEEKKQGVTALIVGEIIEGMDQVWFPNDYTNLISFASGNRVSASWLEFRDENGKLVSRKHFPTIKEQYQEGYAVINEIWHGGLGHLISLASRSPEFREDYCRILITHLIEINSIGYHLENRMTNIARTFELLSDRLGLSKQYLMSYMSEPYSQSVKAILNDARDRIKELSSRAKKENLLETSASLDDIESRVANSNNTDGDFGMKVMDILKHYKMPDAVIMGKEYFPQSQSGRSWIQTLSWFRNAPTHKGYFSIQDGTFESDEIVKVENHLHDILVRIVLKTLGYTGKYQPRVIDQIVDDKTVEWVKETTSTQELGYSN